MRSSVHSIVVLSYHGKIYSEMFFFYIVDVNFFFFLFWFTWLAAGGPMARNRWVNIKKKLEKVKA